MDATLTTKKQPSQETADAIRSIARMLEQGIDFRAAVRREWPDKDILGSDADGNDEVRRIEQDGRAMLGFDSRKVGLPDSPHSYAGGNRCTPQEAKRAVQEMKTRHPGMFR